MHPPPPKAAEEREGEEQQHNYLSFLLQNRFFLKHVLDFSQFQGFWSTEKISASIVEEERGEQGLRECAVS